MGNGDTSRYRSTMAPTEEELEQLRERLDEIRKRAAKTDARIEVLMRDIDETIAEIRRVERRLAARR
jgi:uncharacterized coiled-coil DUF342 family protein